MTVYSIFYILTVTGNPSMHLLHVWRGKWWQCTLSVLELIPNIKIFAWATITSLYSKEKNNVIIVKKSKERDKL